MAKSKKPDTRVRKLNIKQKKKVVKTTKVLPGSFRLLWSSLYHIWTNKKLFSLIVVVYLGLYLVLVKGFATGLQLESARETLDDGSDSTSSLSTATALFGALVDTAGNTSSSAASVYQTLLFIIISLAMIWALRKTFDGRSKVGLRDVFYQSMQPFITYILTGLVLIIQFIPAILGITLYGIVIGNSIASSPLEIILWAIFLGMSFGASIYLLSSSIFATYIVTLPGMAPMRALRSARKLVRFRRWQIIRKVLFLPLIITAILLLIFLPLVLFATSLAEILFIVFLPVLLLISHAYFYVLYRELM